MNVDLIIAIIAIVLFIILWPLIKWLAIVLLVASIVFCVKVYIDSRDVKKQIEQDPDKYYGKREDGEGQ